MQARLDLGIAGCAWIEACPRSPGLPVGGAAGGGLGLCALQHVPQAAGTGTGAALRLRAAAGECAGSLCAWQGGWVWL